MSLLSSTLSWPRANQSLLLTLNSQCFSQEAANINLIVIKRRFSKRWWSTMQPMSTERTTILSHKSLNTKTTTYSDGNVGPGFRQAQKCCGFKPLDKIPTTPLFCGFVISLDYKLYFFYLYVLVFMTFQRGLNDCYGMKLSKHILFMQ